MGLLDLFNKLVVEHGSSEVLSKHNALFKDQIMMADKKISDLEKENLALKNKLENTEMTIQKLTKEKESLQKYNFSNNHGRRACIKLPPNQIAYIQSDTFQLGMAWPITTGDRNLFIGREQDADICVPVDEKMSGIHCRLIIKPREGIKERKFAFFLIDEESSNGTFVNGEPLLVGVLQELVNGSVIQAGASTFVLHITSLDAPMTQRERMWGQPPT
jgi:hypothetical protein